MRLANLGELAHIQNISRFGALLPNGCLVLSDFHALELWRHALVTSVRSDVADLSARQMALLLSIYLGPSPHTVRGLAKALQISKPAVSRALDRLGELNYIRRERDDLDRRNVLVQRTYDGAQYLKSFASMIGAAQEALKNCVDQPLAQIVPELQTVNIHADEVATPVHILPAVAWTEAA